MATLDRPAIRRWRLIALFALAAAGVLVVVAIRRWRGRPERTRIVVAVFANRTGDPALEQFGSMAADWVTRGLARTPTVEVVDVGALYVEGRTASGQPTEPLELARRNGAGSVVAGSYYVSGDTLAVRSTVIDGTTGEVLQTVTPVRVGRSESVKALELLQQQVMTAVAGALDVEFRPFTAQPSAPPPYATYQAFVAGQTAYWQGRPAREARDFFQYAAASDSTFLTASVWLAFVGANGAGCALTDSVTQALAGRMAAINRFDQLTLGISAARCRNHWHEAFHLAAEQAALRPRSTYAVYTAGFFALTSGRLRVARDFLRSIVPAHELGWLSDSAKSVYWRDLTAAEHFLGDYETELEDARRLERAFPDRAGTHLIAARALAGLGRSDDALAEVDAVLRLPVDETVRVAGSLSPGLICQETAAELLAHGDSAGARKAAERAVAWYAGGTEERLRGRYERLWLARSLMMLGRLDEALAAAVVGNRADSTDVAYIGLRGVLAGYRGATDQALELDRRLAALEPSGPRGSTWMWRARIAMARGDRAGALEALRVGSEQGVPRVGIGVDIHADPIFEPLKGDPAFEAMLRSGE
jgi:TolB-like protein/tetratricopeptide (TPR) repeat protein